MDDKVTIEDALALIINEIASVKAKMNKLERDLFYLCKDFRLLAKAVLNDGDG